MQLNYLYLLVAALLLPVLAIASEGAGAEGGTDIVARTINFLIFAAILWYLIADKVKAFFQNRTTSVAKELTEIEEKLNSVKAAKEAAQKEAKEAHDKAKELIEIAKKEGAMLAEKIEADTENEIAYLKKALAERMEIEEKKMTREVVSEVIEEMFGSGKVSLSNDDFVNIIRKKVA